MADLNHLNLGKRERQIMEALYARGQASVAEVLETLHNPPSYSGVRGMLRFLEEKGLVRHREEGRKFVYSPTIPHDVARHSALTNLLQTFFSGSVTQAVVSLIDLEKENLSTEDLDRLSRLIEEARKEGR